MLDERVLHIKVMIHSTGVEESHWVWSP